MEPKPPTALVDWLHRATHALPGVRRHQATTSMHHGPSPNRQLANRFGHRTPSARVLVAWQRRIGALFGFRLP